MSRESADILARNIHCTIGEIAIFPNRMHLTCNERVGVYYALALSDHPYVDHVLDIAREAKLNDRWVMLMVDPARPDNPPGCQQNDCFRIQAISLR